MIKRGQIYYIKSNYKEVGSEQYAGRPAVIVSNNKNNYCSEVVEVVYMTTRPKHDLPTHICTRSTGTPSTILCEQIFSVSKLRVGDYIGTLSDDELQALNIALTISLGIDLDGRVIMREPTREELEKMLAELQPKPTLSLEMVPDRITVTASGDMAQELIKITAERDVYKKLVEDLIKHGEE